MEEIIKERLTYNAETGVISNIRSGIAASIVDTKGYGEIRLTINGKMKYLRSHRVAWLLHTGEWPNGVIDHIDGDKLNNRISNLRVTTQRENNANKAIHRNGKLVGCYYKKGRWYSQIQVKGDIIALGGFDTELDAHNAYMEYKRRLLLK